MPASRSAAASGALSARFPAFPLNRITVGGRGDRGTGTNQAFSVRPSSVGNETASAPGSPASAGGGTDPNGR